MNQFRTDRLLLLICSIFTTQEVFYIAAHAKSNSPEELWCEPPGLSGPAAGIPNSGKTKQLIEKEVPLISGTLINVSKFGGDEALRLAKEGIFIGADSADNYIDLANGNILLSPERDIIVGTSEGKISVGAQAIVFISACGTDVLVYNLFQAKPKQVFVIGRSHRLIMQPGQMFVLTQQNTDQFEKLQINCRSIDYSNAKLLNMASHEELAKVFVANFSIASALTFVQPLKQLIFSDKREDRALLARLVKGTINMGDFDAATVPKSVEFISIEQKQPAQRKPD